MWIGKRPGSSNYHLKVSVGTRRIRKSLGTADLRHATARAMQIIEREERRQSGLWSESDEAAALPIGKHIDDFLDTLSGTASAGHIAQRRRALEEMVEQARIDKVPDITDAAISRWLTALERAGRSIQTRNQRLSSAKQFTRWLRNSRRAAHDALALLRPGKVETDRRLVRRALTVSEEAALVSVAKTRALDRLSGQTLSAAYRARLQRQGEQRSLVYLFACRTGVRKNEMREMVWADFDLGPEPTFRVRAVCGKAAKRTVTLPLDEAVAEALRAAGPGLPNARVFTRIPRTQTLYKDLLAIGIRQGERTDGWIDFHSLRHTFITRLSENDVSPAKAQALARHSTVNLTLGHYTHLRVDDLRSALPCSLQAKRRMAGDDDA